MKKISVIIPIYNAMTSGGGMIGRCVDSILEQENFSLNDIEIIMINDGSKDDSLAEIRRIQGQAPDVIRVESQANIGVAATRNKGVQLATGEYTAFLDQDDWVESDYLQTLYSAAKDGNCEVVISGYQRPDSAGRIKKVVRPVNETFFKYRIVAAWAKLHKTDFLVQNNINFFQNSYGEDFPFTYHENLVSERVKIIDYVGYNWFFNEKSVSNTLQKVQNEHNRTALINLFSELYNLQQRIDAKNNETYTYSIFRTVIFYLLFSFRNTSRVELDKTISTITKWLQTHYPELFRGDRLKFPRYPKGEELKAKFTITSFVALYNVRLLKTVLFILR